MKLRNLLAILVSLAAVPVFADSITVNLDLDSATLGPGANNFDFTGTITNNTSNYAYLNSITVDLPGLTVDTSPFLSGPVDINPNQTSVDFTFFSVALPVPYAGPFGNLSGTVTILGGTDEFAQNPIGSAAFSVNVPEQAPQAPEVATLLTAALGLMLVVVGRRRGLRHKAVTVR